MRPRQSRYLPPLYRSLLPPFEAAAANEEALPTAALLPAAALPPAAAAAAAEESLMRSSPSYSTSEMLDVMMYEREEVRRTHGAGLAATSVEARTNARRALNCMIFAM